MVGFTQILSDVLPNSRMAFTATLPIKINYLNMGKLTLMVAIGQKCLYFIAAKAFHAIRLLKKREKADAIGI